ncbi:MAG: hypothetical protein ACLGJC_09120 [Alphaproteobacteria bacterium]
MIPYRFLPALAAAALALSACSVTVPVTGSIGVAGQAMTGTATGYADKTGTIFMQSPNGKLKCSGDYGYIGTSSGRGKLFCNDGRTATVQFNAITYKSGYGYGVADDGTAIRFTYGLSDEEGRQYLN